MPPRFRNTTSRQKRARQASNRNVRQDGHGCIVCLRERHEVVYRGRMPRCEHFACFDCIWTWAHVNPTCPLCKLPVSALLLPAPVGLWPRHEEAVCARAAASFASSPRSFCHSWKARSGPTPRRSFSA
jgi:hypothetical protein